MYMRRTYLFGVCRLLYKESHSENDFCVVSFEYQNKRLGLLGGIQRKLCEVNDADQCSSLREDLVELISEVAVVNYP